jgi:hypothetical protein
VWDVSSSFTVGPARLSLAEERAIFLLLPVTTSRREQSNRPGAFGVGPAFNLAAPQVRNATRSTPTKTPASSASGTVLGLLSDNNFMPPTLAVHPTADLVRPLPTEFQHGGFQYRQLKRVGNAAIFEQLKGGTKPAVRFL